MRVRVRSDSTFPRSRIDFGPGPDFSQMRPSTSVLSSCDSNQLLLAPSGAVAACIVRPCAWAQHILARNLLGFGCSSKSRHKKAQLRRRDTLAAGHPKPLARLRIRHWQRALRSRANPTSRSPSFRAHAGIRFDNLPFTGDRCPSSRSVTLPESFPETGRVTIDMRFALRVARPSRCQCAARSIPCFTSFYTSF